MAYIEREALPLTEIVERKKIFINGRVRTTNVYTKVVALKDLEAAPAADVVPVVRCKDCVSFCYDVKAKMHYCKHCNGLTYVKADRFCCYGKKAEDEPMGQQL